MVGRSTSTVVYCRLAMNLEMVDRGVENYVEATRGVIVKITSTSPILLVA